MPIERAGRFPNTISRSSPLRSQTIYGSLVETFGPYFQTYTKTLWNFNYSDYIRTGRYCKKNLL